MKLLHRTRLPALLIAILSVALISGCARSPVGTVLARVKPLTVNLTFDAPLNDKFHYYTVIDTDGGGTGPIPVFPGIAPGLGWVTGSATHFVEYYRGVFTLCQFVPAGQFVQFRQIGTPISPSVGSQTLSFTIDLNDLAVPGDSIDVNFITVGDPLDNPLIQHRTIDAVYEGGASVLNVSVTKDDTIDNARLGYPEPPFSDDLLNENGVHVDATDITRPLDIRGWSIGIDI